MKEIKILLSDKVEEFIKSYNAIIKGDREEYFGRFRFTRNKSDNPSEYTSTFVDEMHLPSRFQIGDNVRLNFSFSGGVGNCEVIKVHFTESKVLYDILVKITEYDVDIADEKETYIRLYNIDSAFVEPIG